MILSVGRTVFAQIAEASSSTTTKILSDGTRENAEFNYSIKSLGTRWIPVTPRFINPEATEVFRKRIPESYILLIPEKTGVEFEITTEALADVAKSNLQSVAPSVEFGEPSTRTVNGLDWICFNAKVNISGNSFVYGYSVLSKNGYQYQLLFWREGYLLGSVDKDVEKILPHFSLIDPEKVYHSEDFTPITAYSDPDTGFSIDLSKDSWTNWPNHEMDLPQAKFTASHKNSLFLFGIPLYHTGLKPNSRDLKAAILEQIFGLDPTMIASTKDRLIRGDGARFLRSAFSFPGMTINRENQALLDIRNEEGLSYVVGGFSAVPDALKVLEEALSSVKFEVPEDLVVEPESLRLEERMLQSLVLNSIALSMYSQNNFTSAKRYLDRALLFSKEDPVILSNYGSICADLGEYDDIIQLFENNEEALAEVPSFREWYAFALRNNERKEEAEDHYNAVFDTGNMSEIGLWGFLEMLTLDERWDEAIGLCDDYIDFTGSQSVQQWRATFYRGKGDFETALEQLLALKEEVPLELAISYEIALTYNLQENFTKSVEYIDSLEQDIDQYSFLHTLKGNSLLGLQSFVKAKESFERAIELNPLDEEAKSLLKYATSALGKGDVEVNKVEIEPVPLNPKLWEIMTDAKNEAAIADRSHIQYALIALQHERGVVNKSTRRIKISIMDDKGVNAYSTLAFPYDPFSEEVYINEIVVRDKDGEMISTENREDFYVMHNEQSGIVSQDKSLFAPIQGLVKGCTLEYMVTYKWLGLLEEIPYFREYLSYGDPTLVAAVSFTGDKESLNVRTGNGVETVEDGASVFWYVTDIKPYKQEPHQTDIDSFLPYVAIADAELDWDVITQEYLEEIADRLVLDEEVASLSATLVKGLNTNEEKTLAIYNYIQTEFTYKALSFGPRAKIPNTAPQIIENKYGDCKDLALLSNRLLEAAGISSQLALVHTRDEILKDLPSLDQFDHMILYLPEFKGGRFIDCTNRHASLYLAAPIGLEDRDILVLDDESFQIINSGSRKISENTIHSKRVIRVEGNDLSVVEALELSGVPAAYFRFYLSSLQGEELVPSFQSLITSVTGSRAQIQDVSHSSNSDSNAPLSVNFHYILPESVRSVNGVWTISEMPYIWERYYLHVPFIKQRETPFSIDYPFRMSSNVSLQLPDSTSIQESELAKVSFENDYHRFSFESSLERSTERLLQSYQVDLGQNDFSAVEFLDFQKSSQKVLSQISSPVRMFQVPSK